MGKAIPFSQFEHYLDSIDEKPFFKGTILDTNILISAGYEVRNSHRDVIDVLEILSENEYRLFATVNTRSEYLEFQRRLILTEHLFDMVDQFSKYRVPQRARARIQTLKGSLKTSVMADSDKDEVFNDSQLKKIKKAFSAGPHSGQESWLQICNLYLKGKIEQEDSALLERGIEYISPNSKSQQNLFKTKLLWPAAIEICEKSGTAFNDSMILNATKSSNLPFLVTLDFDLGYAALSDPNMKDVIVPDGLFKEYRNYHFP